MRRLLPLALFAAFLIAIPVGSASAAPQSPGCRTLNDSAFDGLNQGGDESLQLDEGDVLRFSANDPHVPPNEPLPSVVRLFIDSELVDFAAYAGEDAATVAYTVPSDGSYDVRWDTDAVFVTWEVSCTPGPGPGPERVTICHRGKERSVVAHTVDNHLRHGDTLGACA